MTTAFYAMECVKLIRTADSMEEYGTILEDVTSDDAAAFVLLYPGFRQGLDDDGLRDVPMNEVRKQYEDTL